MRFETSADFGCDKKSAEVFEVVICLRRISLSTAAQILSGEYSTNRLTLRQKRGTIRMLLQSDGASRICRSIFYDHITDHSAVWSTRKQWRQEGTKASFSERKGLKRAVSQLKNVYRFVWEHQATGSEPCHSDQKFRMRQRSGFLLIPETCQ